MKYNEFKISITYLLRRLYIINYIFILLILIIQVIYLCLLNKMNIENLHIALYPILLSYFIVNVIFIFNIKLYYKYCRIKIKSDKIVYYGIFRRYDIYYNELQSVKIFEYRNIPYLIMLNNKNKF